MIKMVVFDMAGTTVDEDNVVYKTLQRVINNAGYNFTLNEVLENGAGKEKLQAIKDIVQLSGKTPDENFAAGLYQVFDKTLEEAYSAMNVKPQPGAEELFTQLHHQNILVVLNTGYNETTAKYLLKKLGWTEGFQIDAMITATDVKNNRPLPDMIHLAMQKFSLGNAVEVVKIGDSIIDIEEGKNAGCGFTVGITTGAHTAAQLNTAKPDYVIHHLLELLPLLQ